jgi:hypothetical protein
MIWVGIHSCSYINLTAGSLIGLIWGSRHLYPPIGGVPASKLVSMRILGNMTAEEHHIPRGIGP